MRTDVNAVKRIVSANISNILQSFADLQSLYEKKSIPEKRYRKEKRALLIKLHEERRRMAEKTEQFWFF